MCTPCCPNAGTIPEKWQNVVGSWNGDGTVLVIEQGGKLSYERRTGNSSKSINAYVSTWGDSFFKSVVCMCCKETFNVEEMPQQNESQTWTMKVNGITMTKE